MGNNETRRDLDSLKSAYLESMVLRNLTALTIRQVDQYLRLFIGWAKGRGIESADKVDRQALEDYKAYLSTGYRGRRGRPLKSNTIRARLLNVMQWFAWMKKKGVLFFDPLADVQLPRTIRLLPRGVMRPDEIRAVLAQPDLKTPLGYRDRTMMEVLYSTGMRAAELVNLKVPDVDLQKKVARVRLGKGGKDRFVPLATPCCRFLARYLAEIRPELMQGMRPCGNNWLKKTGTAENFVFASIYGGAFSAAWLGQLMQSYIRKAGITRPVSPVHSFRHSVATHLLADGMDVRYVQVFLGHDNINSTQIYTHVERETLQRLLREHHPRALARERFQPFIAKEGRRNAAIA